jgi:restriction endonuclease S subunit
MAVWSIVTKKYVEKKVRIDAEYYKPEFIRLENDILKWNKISELNYLASVTGGKRLPKGEIFSPEGVPYVRVVDIKNIFVDFRKVLNISVKLHRILERYQIKNRDILLTIVGNTVGLTGYMHEKLKKCNFTENCARIRSKKILPEYLLAVLLSKVGQFQVEREKVGTAQPKLSLERLRHFNIPMPSNEKLEQLIGNLISEATLKWKESDSLYKKAEQILLEELGLKDLDLRDNLFYTTTLKKVKENDRMDTYFFEPKFNKVLSKLKERYKLKKIYELTKDVTTGQYCDEYIDKENGAPYIRGTDISNATINWDNLMYVNSLKNNGFKKAKEGDVVTTRVGTIGLIARIPGELEGCIVSDNLIRIRLPKKSEISSYYLTMYLNSPFGKDLMISYSRGSVQQRLNQETLKEIPIPIVPNSLQVKMEMFLVESWEKRKQAKQLLEQAKHKVEEMIEKEAGVK